MALKVLHTLIDLCKQLTISFNMFEVHTGEKLECKCTPASVYRNVLHSCADVKIDEALVVVMFLVFDRAVSP